MSLNKITLNAVNETTHETTRNYAVNAVVLVGFLIDLSLWQIQKQVFK